MDFEDTFEDDFSLIEFSVWDEGFDIEDVQEVMGAHEDEIKALYANPFAFENAIAFIESKLREKAELARELCWNRP
jgi:hypothetical protein